MKENATLFIIFNKIRVPFDFMLSPPLQIAYEEYTDTVQAVTLYEDNTNTEFHFKKCKQEAEAMSAKKFNEDERFRVSNKLCNI